MVAAKSNGNQSLCDFVLTSPAPIETAAKLSSKFRHIATREKARARDLAAASDYCQAMAVDLMALAATGHEDSAASLLRSVDHRGVTILDMLIDCEQKDVVSHESVQEYLTQVWTGHLSNWGSGTLMALFVASLLLPPIWLLLSLPLWHQLDRVPVIKFISYLVSHIYLTGLFIICTVCPPYNLWETADLVPRFYECLLLAWLSGLVVSQLTNPEDRAGLGWIKVQPCSIVLIFHALSVVTITIQISMAVLNRRQDSFSILFDETVAGLNRHAMMYHWIIWNRNTLPLRCYAIFIHNYEYNRKRFDTFPDANVQFFAH